MTTIIYIYITQQIEDNQLQAKIFQMGEGPISCMKRHHHKLYVCSGEEVLLINIVDFTIQERWNATHPKYEISSAHIILVIWCV